MLYAEGSSQQITWAPAHDRSSSKVLQETPEVAREKLKWLNRHDKDCGGLYGMLPLVKGMPVCTADHIDRNPEKQILRGRRGTIDSWVLHDSENSCFEQGCRILGHVPKVVLVQFYDWVEQPDGSLKEEPCKWEVDGVNRPGVYPIFPWRRSWHLDQQRKKPVLEVKRQQIPLAPAYAMTAHAAQGTTLAAAILDLQLGRGVSAIASYVAMTRVRQRSDLLIYRDFDREVFTRGTLEGPTLLLKKLRGEFIDWKAIEEMHTPKQQCRGPCMLQRFKDEFTAKEWRNKQDPVCKVCVEKIKEKGASLRCEQCRKWYAEDDFVEKNLLKEESRVCRICRLQVKTCSSCGRKGTKKQAFTAEEWVKGQKDMLCRQCGGTDARTLLKMCDMCQKSLQKSKFCGYHWNLALGEERKCITCDVKECRKCCTAKPYTFFSYVMWELPSDSPARCCRVCESGGRQRQYWTCSVATCKQRKPVEEFSTVVEQYRSKGEGSRQDYWRCCVRDIRESG
jgi:hypothetical protein